MPRGSRKTPAPCCKTAIGLVDGKPSRLSLAELREPEKSERIPRRARGIFQIADIGAEAQTETGADRHQHDVVCRQRRHPETADDVGRAIDARSEERRVGKE